MTTHCKHCNLPYRKKRSHVVVCTELIKIKREERANKNRTKTNCPDCNQSMYKKTLTSHIEKCPVTKRKREERSRIEKEEEKRLCEKEIANDSVLKQLFKFKYIIENFHEIHDLIHNRSIHIPDSVKKQYPFLIHNLICLEHDLFKSLEKNYKVSYNP